MKKVLYIVGAVLLCAALCAGALMDLGAGTIWGRILQMLALLVFSFAFHCLPIVIVRYLVKRSPFKNAAQLCAGYACVVIFSLTRAGIYLDSVDKILCAVGVGLGSWVNYMMLSR